MIKEKNRLYQEFLIKRDPDKFKAFKVYRNKLTKLQKQAKRDYHFKMFDGVTDSKQLWNKLNAIISTKQVTNDMSELVINNEIYRGAVLANKFNEYFTSLVNSSHNCDSLGYLPPALDNSVFANPTDTQEVISVFQHFKMSKSEDIDGLKLEPIIHILDLVCTCLVHIYNRVHHWAVF